MFNFLKKPHTDIDTLIKFNSISVADASTYFKVPVGIFRRSLKRNTGQYSKEWMSISFTDAIIAAIGTVEGQKTVQAMLADGTLYVQRED